MPDAASSVEIKQKAIALVSFLFIVTIGLLSSTEIPSSFDNGLGCNWLNVFYVCLIAITTCSLGILALANNGNVKKYIYGSAAIGVFFVSALLAQLFYLINFKLDNSAPVAISVTLIKYDSFVGKGGSGQSAIVTLENNPSTIKKFRVNDHFFYTIKPKTKLIVSVKKGWFNRPWILSYQKAE